MHKELFNEIEKHLVDDEKPSIYLNTIIDELPMLSKTRDIEQSKLHHPEGNVWNHTVQVVDIASKVKKYVNNKDEFMWAALLHDIGKIKTTRLRKGRITAYDHDKVGAEMVYELFEESTMEQEKIIYISRLVRWHMQVLFVVKGMPFAEVENMKREVNLKEIILLNLCDRLGRGKLKEEKVNEEQDNIMKFTKKIGADIEEIEKIMKEVIYNINKK